MPEHATGRKRFTAADAGFHEGQVSRAVDLPTSRIRRLRQLKAYRRWSSTVMMMVMVIPHQPGPVDIATFSPNGSKARFGVAYLRAICSQAGVGFTETSIDEDVLAIDGAVDFATASARVQVKCTGKFRIHGGSTATWPADDRWWAKWHGSCVPVYFVLVVMDPDEQPDWLDHRVDGTMHRAAAFWARVDKMSQGASITVPKSQRLTADTLRQWSSDVDACFQPQLQGGN
ncbi:DUF4365 domain-containing protein [Micromonospora musae]|uniref:DUF4365 domain-containing protein n=1 Tax=Micromonospora musae TaxID=1894970 RepID=UPI0013157045|nr:DUF4365 domain-containing protein [Micromonospora musae]